MQMDTTISVVQMEQILESYKNVFLEDKEIPMPDISFTRGHFKRGVK